MTPPAAPSRALVRALAAAAVFVALAAPAAATAPEAANFDARPAREDQATSHEKRAREALRDDLGRFGALSLDEHTGTLRSVGRLDGFLTGPSGRDGADVALGFVKDRATAFGLDGDDLDGLRLVDRSFAGGVEHLRWEQRHRGVPLADAGLQAAVTGAGRLLSVTGPPAADVDVRSVEPELGAATAYDAARAGVDAGPGAPVAAADGGPERETAFEDGGRASLTLYRSGEAYRLAWRVLAPVSSTEVYDMLVDAGSGVTVRRANRVNFAVPADVFPYTPDADVIPSGQIEVDFAPWLTSSTALSGPYAHAFTDLHDVVPFRSGSNVYDLTPEAGSDVAPDPVDSYKFELHTAPNDPAGDGCPELTSTFPTSACTWYPGTTTVPDPGPGWQDDREQSATQLFYFVNTFRDHLHDDPDILFRDGDFAHTGQALGDPNATANPARSDPVLAQALDGADTDAGRPDAEHVNNANFLTLPDGQPGLMQMYLWKLPYGGYDGANEASVVFHEYTHGMTSRLVTDAAGFGALNGRQSGALGEGWSDYYALDHLEAQALESDNLRFGRYLDNGNGTLLRYQPIDCTPASPASQCPAGAGSAGSGGFTFEDFGAVDDGPEVHHDGEIWAQTLWSLRTELIARYGRDPLDPDNGIARGRRYITESLRLAPPEPSFLDMRNAMLQASPDADDDLLWSVFAERGMGYFAATEDGDDIAPVADFTDPAGLSPSGTLTGTVQDEDGHPVPDATVGIAGFDSGLGPQHVDATDANGAYAITGVPTDATHAYPVVRARKAGYAEDRDTGVHVLEGPVQTTRSFQLVRDWSSAAGGAAVDSFDGPNNSGSGCGPGGLIDDDAGTVWGTTRAEGGRAIVIKLPVPVDVGSVKIDPSAGCGDDDTAALGAYQLAGASTPGGPYTALGGGAFGIGDLGALREVLTNSAQAVRYVRLHANTPQSTAPGTSGEDFIDVAELHVAKVPGSPIGATAVTGGADGVGVTGATLTGTVDGHGTPASVVFEYGSTVAYGSAVAADGSGPGATSVAAAVTGLEPSTEYHFRVVALRDSRRYEGADQSFVTGAAPVEPTPQTPLVSGPPDETAPAGPLATLPTRSLRATRKGVFKVRFSFGPTAPAGISRLAVLGDRRKRLAVVLLTTRPGQTVTKTLRLNRAGLRAIRPGRSRRVTLELRLPGGKKVTQRVRLARARR